MKMFKIFLISVLPGMISVAHADAICAKSFEGYNFREAQMAVHYGVTCLYGDEPDYNHLYRLFDNYVPASGPWEGNSDLVFCKGQNTNCVFRIVDKKS